MSVLRRCDFFKAVDGNWYMILGDFEYSYNDYQCSTYGPFASQEDVDNYLRYNFSNPGGACVDHSGAKAVPKDAINPLR